MSRYKVSIEFGGSDEVEVEAEDEQEAEQLALKECGYYNVEISNVDVEEVE